MSVCLWSCLSYRTGKSHLLCTYCHTVTCGFSCTLYVINGTIFGKYIMSIKCVLIFSTTFAWSISQSRKNSARYDHKCTYIGLHLKYPFFLSDFKGTWIFSTRVQNPETQNIKKISPVEAELFYADRRTDMTKLRVAVRNFANASKTATEGCRLIEATNCLEWQGN